MRAMCGRFNVIDSPGLQQLLRDLGVDIQLPERCNIAPTDDVTLLRQEPDGSVVALTARWWLTPSWSRGPDQKYAMFNARSEGLDTSRAYRTPFRRQRGIVPMSSFIEWRSENGARQPYLITNTRNAIAAAALWDSWRDPASGEELLSCSLVTTAAAPAFEHWHRRMPVMLCGVDQQRWLNNETQLDTDDGVFQAQLREPLQIAPIDPAINRAGNKDATLLNATGDVVEIVENQHA